MIVGTYFAYPYLNNNKYNKVVEKYQHIKPAVNDDEPLLIDEADSLGEQFGEQVDMTERTDIFKKERIRLMKKIDSLQSANQNLKKKLEKKDKSESLDKSKSTDNKDRLNNQNSGVVLVSKKAKDDKTDQETFSEMVKSLLNLDEQQLSPIVNKLSKEQLIRLYKGAGTIQREKLLRSLDPDRAAKLMTEIML